jgi:hypothetical protein
LVHARKGKARVILARELEGKHSHGDQKT